MKERPRECKKKKKVIIDSGRTFPLAYSRSSVVAGEGLLSHQNANHYYLFS